MTLGRYDALELDNLLKKAGFVDNEARRKAWANAMKESWGTPAVINENNPNGSKDWGLFQINDIWRKADPTIDFSKLLGDGLYNAETAFKITSGGINWSSWGIGETGYAGQLKKSNYDMWALIQKYFYQHYDAYPQAILNASAYRQPPTVHLAKVKPGQRNLEVKVYHWAIRSWLWRQSVDVLAINPTMPTGYFGTELSALTRAAYQRLVVLTGDPNWTKANDVPGPSLLKRLGLTVV